MNYEAIRSFEVKRRRYSPPEVFKVITLREALAFSGRKALDPRQLKLLAADDTEATIYAAGDIDLLACPAVSIVGTRDLSDEGRVRAKRLARELVEAGVVVTSAVIGTPLDKAYPAENSSLQELIYTDHLLLSPFRSGEAVFKSNFPKRNRVMAALTDATVIVEASDTSGTLHQAAECQRLGRWLFIMKSVAEDDRLTWPKSFLGKEKVAALNSTRDILDVVIANKGS
jgi:DNA processing protein